MFLSRKYKIHHVQPSLLLGGAPVVEHSTTRDDRLIHVEAFYRINRLGDIIIIHYYLLPKCRNIIRFRSLFHTPKHKKSRRLSLFSGPPPPPQFWWVSFSCNCNRQRSKRVVCPSKLGAIQSGNTIRFIH